MTNEMRLARVNFGPGWIDLGYGEPVLIQKILKKYISAGTLPDQGSYLDSQYQPPQGYQPLVNFLEQKYGAKVVVTAGAKQGMAAVAYALKKMGHLDIIMHRPYWTSTPNLLGDQGLRIKYLDQPGASSSAMFITSPNNPDGFELKRQQLADLSSGAKAEGVKLIHDAAYYTPIYMAEPHADKVGDVQIYSFAKMWGLSGLRIGYVVCHDETFVAPVAEFVEASCSGVSTAAQTVALSLEQHFASVPAARLEFEAECREAIAANRKLLTKLNPEVLMVDPCDSNSMFGWAKVGPKYNAKEVKVNMIDGDLFGKPGYVRFNLAVDSDLIETVIKRLNGEVNGQERSDGVSQHSDQQDQQSG